MTGFERQQLKKELARREHFLERTMCAYIPALYIVLCMFAVILALHYANSLQVRPQTIKIIERISGGRHGVRTCSDWPLFFAYFLLRFFIWHDKIKEFRDCILIEDWRFSLNKLPWALGCGLFGVLLWFFGASQLGEREAERICKMILLVTLLLLALLCRGLVYLAYHFKSYPEIKLRVGEITLRNNTLVNLFSTDSLTAADVAVMTVLFPAAFLGTYVLNAYLNHFCWAG